MSPPGTSRDLLSRSVVQPLVHGCEATTSGGRHEVSVVVQRDVGRGVAEPLGETDDRLSGFELDTGVGVPQDVEHVPAGQLVYRHGA